MLIKIERMIINGVIPTLILGTLFILFGAFVFVFAVFSLFTNTENFAGALFFTFGGAAAIFLGWQALAEKAKEIKNRNIKY
jgi:amino acid transporter